MVEVRCSKGHIDARCEARECLEIVNKMRLVVVAAIERQLCPINLPLRMDGAQHPLEAADARKSFGSQADLLMKELDESARAKADACRHGSYTVAACWRAELLKRVRHSRVQFKRADELV